MNSVVSQQCADICIELCSIGQHVTVDKIIQVLLQRYNIAVFDQLGLGSSILTVPSLFLVWTLERKIAGFLETYVASRSVTCLASLDHDLTQYLKSLNIISVKTMVSTNCVNAEMAKDPNELDLEEEDEAPLPPYYSVINCFSDYAMGPLHAHPIVLNYFGGLVIPSEISVLPTSVQIMKHLLHYLTEYKCYQFMNDFKVEDFTVYLKSLYGINDLRLCGVHLQGDLQEEVQALKHVAQQKYSMYAEAATIELTAIQGRRQSSRSSSDRNDSGYQQSAARALTADQVKLRSCGEFSPEVQSLIDKVQSDLKSPFSPSYGKVHKLILSYWTQTQSGEEPVTSRKKQKRSNNRTKLQEATEDDCEAVDDIEGTRSGESVSRGGRMEGVKAQLVSAATEYVMLHLGGRKYLNKRLEAIEQTATVEKGEEEEEQKDDSEDTEVVKEVVDEKVVASDEEQVMDSCVGSARLSASASAPKTDKKGSASAAPGALDTSDSAAGAASPPVSTPFTPPVPKYEGRLHSNLLQVAAVTQYPDSLHCDIAVIPSSQLQHLLPSVGCLDLTDVREVGLWGERLVNQYLISQYAALLPTGASSSSKGINNSGDGVLDIRKRVEINWLNEVEESKACYDFILTNNQVVGKNRTTYIEVKTTRYSDLNVFELSLWEWEFAVKEPRVPYHIYRVFNAGDVSKVRIVVVKDVLKSVQERKIKLCLAL